MTPEQALSKQIEIECGKIGWAAFHINVGEFKFWDPIKKQDIFFKTGAPKGFPDYHILTHYGFTVYVETKIKPRKPTKDQIKWLNWLNKRGYYARVIYTLDEFLYLMEEIRLAIAFGNEPKQIYLDEKGNPL